MSRVKPRKETPDPLIDEVRAVRKALSEQFGNDLDALGKYLRKIGDRYREQSGQGQTPTVSRETGLTGALGASRGNKD